MTKIVRSRYSILQVFLILVFPLISCVVVSFVYKESNKQVFTVDRKVIDEDGRVFTYFKSEKQSISLKNIFALSFVFGFSIYFILLFIRRAPIVRVDLDFVDIKWIFGRSLTLDHAVIERIDITDVQDFAMFGLFHQQAQATTIYLKDGTKHFFWEFYYSNMPALRIALRDFCNKTDQLLIERARAVKTNGFSGLRKYSGNPYTCLNTISSVGILGFFFFFLSNSDSNVLMIFFLIFTPLLYFFYGLQMHYFFLSDEKLIVKNHYWPWVNQTFFLNEIEELAFESPHKRSNALRVITANYKSRLFSAGSLRDSDWRELREDILKSKISFRNGFYI